MQHLQGSRGAECNSQGVCHVLRARLAPVTSFSWPPYPPPMTTFGLKQYKLHTQVFNTLSLQVFQMKRLFKLCRVCSMNINGSAHATMFHIKHLIGTRNKLGDLQLPGFTKFYGDMLHLVWGAYAHNVGSTRAFWYVLQPDITPFCLGQIPKSSVFDAQHACTVSWQSIVYSLCSNKE